MATLQTVKSEYYIVKSGDTLSSIASKFKKTLAQIITWNPQIKNPNLIYPNQQVKIGETIISSTPTQPKTTSIITPTQPKTWDIPQNVIPSISVIEPQPRPSEPATQPKTTDSNGIVWIIAAATLGFLFLNKEKKR